MSSTLSEGVRVPDIGSVNWGADVNFNWGLLNTCLANISGNVKVDAENTWTAPQTFTETISGSIDGVAARAVGDEDGNNIKTALAGKQSSLSQSQLDACNSGITASAVQQIGTNTSNISALQTAVASKAADADVVHKAGAETITGNKTFTGAVVTHNVTPETDNTYSLGSSSLRWTRFYGTDSIFLHYQGLTFGTPPTQATYFGLRLNDNTGAAYGDVLAKSDPDGHNALRLRCRNTDGTNTYDRQISLIVQQNGITQFIPNATGVFDLGRASAKWKTLNGINPGALSLPSDSGVSFSGDITNKTGTTNNPKTWTVNGWGYIRIPNSSTSDFISVVATSTRETYLVTGTGAGNNNIGVSFPIVAGRTYNIYVNTSGTVTAYYFPCLGNV